MQGNMKPCYAFDGGWLLRSPPDFFDRKVNSGYIQGHRVFQQGLSTRPAIPCQPDVARAFWQSIGKCKPLTHSLNHMFPPKRLALDHCNVLGMQERWEYRAMRISNDIILIHTFSKNLGHLDLKLVEGKCSGSWRTSTTWVWPAKGCLCKCFGCIGSWTVSHLSDTLRCFCSSLEGMVPCANFFLLISFALFTHTRTTLMLFSVARAFWQSIGKCKPRTHSLNPVFPPKRLALDHCNVLGMQERWEYRAMRISNDIILIHTFSKNLGHLDLKLVEGKCSGSWRTSTTWVWPAKGCLCKCIGCIGSWTVSHLSDTLRFFCSSLEGMVPCANFFLLISFALFTHTRTTLMLFNVARAFWQSIGKCKPRTHSLNHVFPPKRLALDHCNVLGMQERWEYRAMRISNDIFLIHTFPKNLGHLDLKLVEGKCSGSWRTSTTWVWAAKGCFM